jgi:glycerol-3-phosphate dehydrogenase
MNAFLRRAISPGDVVWAFAGVRALYDDGARRPEDTTREYVLTLDRRQDSAPLLTVYGGKITTYRRLAEAAIARLAPLFPGAPYRTAWTARHPLPGGDFARGHDDDVVHETRRLWPFLAEGHARRMVAAYGTRVGRVLDGVARPEHLGPRFGDDLTGAEIRYLMRHEWAETADDVLWRRSKLGLEMSKQEHAAVERFMTGAIGT